MPFGSRALLLPILNKCRNSLKELRLGDGTEANAAPIGECSELEVFHTSGAVCARLQDIVGGLPKLRECDFSCSPLLTDEGVISLAMSCPGLELLHLAFCRSITDAAIASLVQCRALKELNLSYNSQLTDAAFTGLSEGCWPEMETLDLEGLRLLSDTGFSSLARACSSLVEVHCKATNMTDEAVWMLCQLCPSILKLDIGDCSVTDRSLVAISEHLPSLTHLWCEMNDAVTDDGIEKLVAKCNSIKELSISRCPSITDRSVQSIADHCPALEILNVDNNDRITAVSLEALGNKCRQLEHVYMSGLEVSEEDQESLQLLSPSIYWEYNLNGI
jgi:Leucine-rich repeat (LRR) protein